MEVYPLVMDKTTGQVREMQPSDTLAVYSKEVDFRNMTSDETINVIKKCMPVYVSSADKVKLGNATAPVSSKIRGLAMKSANPGVVIPVQGSGALSATKQEWDEALGVDINAVGYSPIGLTPGVDYFLGLGEGRISATPPASAGQTIVYLGTADSPETMDVDIDRAIALS
ncbi:MAG: hypothetical protein KBF93_19010 [Leptospiraceae bacterium]|nr:hypothetical protein [Leptospiraceae bacterium]